MDIHAQEVLKMLTWKQKFYWRKYCFVTALLNYDQLALQQLKKNPKFFLKTTNKLDNHYIHLKSQSKVELQLLENSIIVHWK